MSRQQRPHRRRSELTCNWCQQIKSRDEFEEIQDRRGRTCVLTHCKDCNSPDKPKMCIMCGIVKEPKDFWAKTKVAPKFGYFRRKCTLCVNRGRYYTPAQGKPREKSDRLRHQAKRLSALPKPPGWTPTPSLDDMASWYYGLIARRAAPGTVPADQLRNRIPVGE
jgi:hypothetical protein